MNEFLTTVSSADKHMIKEEESNAKFRFGDGVESISTKKLTIHVKIGSRKYCLAVEVVKNEIPLLISKPVMKKLGSKESDLELKNVNGLLTERK